MPEKIFPREPLNLTFDGLFSDLSFDETSWELIYASNKGEMEFEVYPQLDDFSGEADKCRFLYSLLFAMICTRL